MTKRIPHLTGILAIIAGILILVWPNILSFAVAIYLIVIGVLDLIEKRSK